MKLDNIFRLFWLTAVVLSGCSPPTTPDTTALPPAFDPARFRGGETYHILPQASQIRIQVYRSGPLARLGHNHIISTREIRGRVYRHEEPRNSGIVLQLPVNDFEVDDPTLRATAGPAFAGVPSAKDVAGTRYNMLGEQVLDAGRYPIISITSVTVSGSGNTLDALMRVTVRGVSTDIKVPIHVQRENRSIIIKGEAGISQTELGIAPFSILMGAIAVQDNIIVQFELVAAPND